MSPHRIAVLLPPRDAPQVWDQWVTRQHLTGGVVLSAATWRYRGVNHYGHPYEARGFKDAQVIRGSEFDEVVIAHPQVSNELIQAARAQLR